MRKILALLLMLAVSYPLAPSFATITTTASQTTLVGNNSTNLFNFSFVADSVSNIKAYITNSSGQQTSLLPSQYLVALNPIQPGALWSVGGTVTYPLMGSPLPAGSTITIQRILPLVQDTSMSNQGDFYPEVTEQALDTSVMQTQQVSARTGQIRGTWITNTAYNFGDIVVDGLNGNDTGNIYTCALSNTSGTWSTDLANGDWSLALNVQGIVNFNPAIQNNYLFANISNSSAAPYGVAASPFIDSAFGSTQGSILYRNSTTWTTLPPGTNGQFLSSGGSSANPSWQTAVGTGTVTDVYCGMGLTCSPSPIVGIGTASLATIANNSLMANATGGTAVPSSTTLSAFLDSVLGNTQGAIIYRGGSVWAELAPGTSGQTLITNGSSQNPSYAFAGATAWVRFDGTVSSPVIAASYNVASVTKQGTGEYTVTFTNAMVDANYGVMGTADVTSNDPNVVNVDHLNYTTPLTTTATHILVSRTGNQASSDSAYITVSFLGN